MGKSEYLEALGAPFPVTETGISEKDWSDPTADYSERSADVTHVFEDGGMVVKFSSGGRRYEPLDGQMYYVPAIASQTADYDGHPSEHWYQVKGSYRHNNRERRAMTIGRLQERTGFWGDASGSGDSIPVSVAVDGQKAIAAYLWAMHRLEPQAIATKMDKSESTVRQYLSDYKAGRFG